MFVASSFSQTKMKITLNNGIIKSGYYNLKTMTLGYPSKPKIISTKTKEKYNIDDIESIIMYTETDSAYFEVIQTKKYTSTKKAELKLGQVLYQGNYIEVYAVSEIVYQGGAIGVMTTANPYNEKYVKRKNDEIAYNMGYIYGAGQRGIKKRVRDYFTDCPILIEKVDNNEIDKEETLEIALFYENNCGK